MKRTMIIFVNAVVALVILALILATWMPAIYTSEWFHKAFPRL